MKAAAIMADCWRSSIFMKISWHNSCYPNSPEENLNNWLNEYEFEVGLLMCSMEWSSSEFVDIADETSNMGHLFDKHDEYVVYFRWSLPNPMNSQILLDLLQNNDTLMSPLLYLDSVDILHRTVAQWQSILQKGRVKPFVDQIS